MRPIKFRAWHFKEKKMLEVDELNHIASWLFDWMLWVNGANRTIGIQWWKHNDCVVMQSTWLRDKNGRDIYEWDIVQSTRPAAMKYKVIRDDEVAWFLFEDEFKAWFSPYGRRDVVIIGNIWESWITEYLMVTTSMSLPTPLMSSYLVSSVCFRH